MSRTELTIMVGGLFAVMLLALVIAYCLLTALTVAMGNG